MTKILTVDDSRAIRQIVLKQLVELGFDVDEAEDGEQGLARLEEVQYDLVLLDVTMPVLDGPGMLAKMRERDDKTPVLMLTSESKKTIVAEVMKLGIADYILKPFKPEDLRAKVTKIVGGGNPAAAVSRPVSAAPAAVSAPAMSMSNMDADASRQFIDVLVIDDMENVHKKLRTMLPAHMTLNSSVSAQAALVMCRERVYRAILIDSDIPDVDVATLVPQLRAIQPHAVPIALCLRSAHDVNKEMRDKGFTDVLHKPFDKDSVDNFLLKYFDNQELVSTEDNLITVAGFSGKEDRVEKYFQRVAKLAAGFLEKIAAACYDEAIIDLTAVPARPERIPRMVVEISQRAQAVGLGMRLVGNAELKKILQSFADTSSVPVSSTVAEAKAAA
jgi:two-component system cell cycle response regulator